MHCCLNEPIWFATGPLDHGRGGARNGGLHLSPPGARQRSDRTCWRRAPGRLVVDGTCGGGGHAEAILQTGADVLASRSGSGRDQSRPANGFRALAGASPCVRRISARREGCSTNSESPDRRRVTRSRRFLAPTRKRRARIQHSAQRSARHADGSAPRTDRRGCDQRL